MRTRLSQNSWVQVTGVVTGVANAALSVFPSLSISCQPRRLRRAAMSLKHKHVPELMSVKQRESALSKHPATAGTGCIGIRET